jgi:hypothetical protein
MSPEKQRITIAEACGWVMKTEQVEHTNGYQWTETRKFWVSPHGKRGELPDYLGDLNAMHAAEEVMTERQRCDYASYVYDIACQHQQATEKWRYISMTAAQRAEALLRTLGKWEDDK